jgi:hypothetical protein
MARGVDVITCSSGGIAGPINTALVPRTPGYHVAYSDRVRREVGIKTVAVGLITEAHYTEQILSAGQADLIALARELLYNPHWPVHAAKALGIDNYLEILPQHLSYWLKRREEVRRLSLSPPTDNPETAMAWRMIVAALLIGLSQQGAHAQYPTKPVRVVVPYPAGGAVDSFARVLTQQLSELWDQPVVVENRPGGSTTIGAEQVAKSPADGYTLMLTAELTLVTVPHLYEKFHTTHCGILRRLQRSFPQPRLWSPILRCRLRQ